ncbi:hypothetical protein LTR27_007837 [Elasticomyces elasticus]|nr:hypothetical protein LTR27_007837 [Elasticomyces elasticus]
MLRCGKQIRWQHAAQTLRAPGVRHALPIGPLTTVERVATRCYATTDTARGHYAIFNRITPPSGNAKNRASNWAPLVEACLPAGLRQTDVHPHTIVDTSRDRAEILLAARQLPKMRQGTDLLYDLAVSQGRWKAAVWLMKDLIDHFGPNSQLSHHAALDRGPWNGQGSLDLLTEEAIDLPRPEPVVHPGPSLISALELTEEQSDSTAEARKPEAFRRNVLGLIWRTLGAMIISCGDGPVRPEILEIIAHLHHQGLVPKDIYNRTPREDETAIQQPPILHLLSSRILTSLSDAAWRAHERILVEEASATSGRYVPLRPEIPGTAYRVRVAGVRPEVWLEFILWACLHGEWVLEGAALLQYICNQSNPQWKPISWRSLAPASRDRPVDWDNLDYIFNTRAPATMDQDTVVHDVKRTVSSEVVNAYVDAVLGQLNAGEPDRVLSASFVLDNLRVLQEFLERSGLKLGAGSWDSAVMRLVESLPATSIGSTFVEGLINLSPGFGGEIRTSEVPAPPPYVLDGSAAIIGVAHRALRTSINAGNLKESFRLLRTLQVYTDANRRSSLAAFFASPQFGVNPEGQGLFTSNFETIEYPAFELQLPSTILGPLLDLVTDTRSFYLGKWLLYNDEIDGPFIVESSYSDPIIAPALVRFAIATNDKELLSKLVQKGAREEVEAGETLEVPQNVLQAVLNAQIELHRWTAVRHILKALAKTKGSEWTIFNLAVLARTMILVGKTQGSGDEKSGKDLAEAKSIFAAMIKGDYSGPDHVKGADIQEQLRTLLTVVSVVGTPWATLCNSIDSGYGHFYFNLPTRSFNTVLEGAIEAHGISVARRLIMLFWPREVRIAQAKHLAETSEGSQISRAEQQRVGLEKRQPTKIELLRSDGAAHVAMYGGLQPNITTIRMIFREALDQLKPKAASETALVSDSPITSAATSGYTRIAKRIVRWCIQRLRNLGMAEADIRDEFEEMLPEQWRERALPFDAAEAGEEALSKRTEGEEGATEADEAEADEGDDDIDDRGNNNIAEEKREAT